MVRPWNYSYYSIEYDNKSYDLNAENIDDIPFKVDMTFISNGYLELLLSVLRLKIHHMYKFDIPAVKVSALLEQLNHKLADKNSSLHCFLKDDKLFYNCRNIEVGSIFYPRELVYNPETNKLEVASYDLNAENIDDIPFEVDMIFIFGYLESFLSKLKEKIKHMYKFDNPEIKVATLLKQLNHKLSDINSGLHFFLKDDKLFYNCSNTESFLLFDNELKTQIAIQ
jgi:hypothetical protein